MTLYEEGSAAADRRFTGQRWQDTIGLYDYRARWYDPALGRFISADTLVPEPGDPQSLNRFSYVNNNPLRYTDPTGHYLLLEDAAEDFSAFGLYWTVQTGYRILSGGSHFRNYYERAYGNYYLSGMRTRLPPNPGGAFGSTVIGSATNAYRELWASPQGSWAIMVRHHRRLDKEAVPQDRHQALHLHPFRGLRVAPDWRATAALTAGGGAV